MTTPAGQIKFSDISTEFGMPPSKNLGAYRISQSIAGKTWPLDSGVPVSGQIKFSDLRGKTLNVVVDIAGAEEYNVSAESKYISGVAVGGFKSLPSRLGSSTKKVYNVVRKPIGGSSGDGVAFRTGSWDSSTVELKIIVASGGEIIGRGGNGASAGGAPAYGSGMQSALPEQTGSNGSPAIYSTFPCSVAIESGGRVQGGGGGGGGAGGGCCNPDSNPQDPVAGAGGGGGGAGLPAGTGGSSTPSTGGVTRTPTDGSPGTRYAGGVGGQGGSTDGVQNPRDCAAGGGGGGGGGPTPGSGGDRGLNGCGNADYGASGGSSGGGNGGNGAACRSGAGSRLGGTGGSNGLGIAYNTGVSVNIQPLGGVYFGGSGTGVF